MIGEQFLLLPGPTPVPERVVRAMSKPLVNHRGTKFQELLTQVTAGVKKVYRTQQNVLIYPASGTGGLEAAVVNFISPGDKVLAVSIGVFGDRFAEIAAQFGARVQKLDFPWGKPADPQRIKEILDADKQGEIGAVLITQNETSTGVYNDLKSISEACGNHPALLLVDAVSGLAAADLRMDEWGLDVVISGSQKAFMIPPGLAFMAFNEKAFQVHKQCTCPSYYWDLDKGMKYLEKGQNPFTPPISLYYGLGEALTIIFEEGLDQVLERHLNYRNMVRSSVKAMGLELLAGDDCASPALTSVIAPGRKDANLLRRQLQEDFNITLAGGQQSLDDVIFRIGHLGYVRELDLFSVLAALELVLIKNGSKLEMGVGVKEAQKFLFQLHNK
ncbi:MAG TPA: alanine--glyoxylate aminotransferase family protein [Syntrophomonadaceae bacterium]|nr:alanine--glyoxylate aminotransferase family protein [Syntrophomonadaceae bacterium]